MRQKEHDAECNFETAKKIESQQANRSGSCAEQGIEPAPNRPVGIATILLFCFG